MHANACSAAARWPAWIPSPRCVHGSDDCTITKSVELHLGNTVRASRLRFLVCATHGALYDPATDAAWAALAGCSADGSPGTRGGRGGVARRNTGGCDQMICH